jgi:transcriptional regulator with XRE-family HTH domain
MNLRECIKDSGKKDYEVANGLGVSNGTLSLWLSGDRIPSKVNMVKLFNYFKDLDSTSFYK